MPKPNSYDQFKEFQGKRYTGMKVGRKHHWKYDPGDWIEKKVTPDKWEISYSVVKRRAGKAPEGSGAPVGTGYRWYILANQIVTKLDANSYQTEMVGVKYKLAHKRAEKESWSSSEKAQRKALLKVLREMIADLESAEADGNAAAMPGADGHDDADGKAKAKTKVDGHARPSRNGKTNGKGNGHARAKSTARKTRASTHYPRASGAQRRAAPRAAR
jgi:hypothetical protein